MKDKKAPGRFTISFNINDPRQRMVVNLLNQQGRSKAQLISSAILHYISCTEIPGAHTGVPRDLGALERLVLEILERYSGQTLPSCEHTDEDTAPNEAASDIGVQLEDWFGGKDGINAVLNSLEAFQQNSSRET